MTNPKTPTCPLCGSSNVVTLESLATHDIRKLYLRKINVSVDDQLSGIDTIHMCQCNDCKLIVYLPLVTGSEAFYEDLQRLPDYYENDKPEYHIAAEWIPADASVLEIGCGTGNFAKLIPGRAYRGLEFSEKASLQAQAQGLRVSIEPIEDFAKHHAKQFDVLCMFQVLEHTSSPRAFLQSCISCIKPDGLLIIAVPSYDSFLSSATNHFLDMPPHHTTRWPDDALRSLADIHPLELLRLEHESLPEEHAIFCSQTLFCKAVYRMLGRTPPVIDLSPLGKTINLAARILCNAALIGRRSREDKQGSRVICLYQRNDKKQRD